MFLFVGRFFIRWEFCQLLILPFSLRALLSIAALPGAVVAQTPVNNLQTILQLFDRVAMRVGEEISRQDYSAVRVQSALNAKPEERFFAARLTAVFKDSLRLTVLAAPVDSFRTTVLTYQLSRCEIVYRKLPHRRFRRSVRRLRTANIFVEVVAQNAATRRIEFQKFFTESVTDTLTEKILPLLEEASLPFTIGRNEEPPKGLRWLEPVLITSATGAVIYLFYALRSR
jgi:hypothetical protein